MKRNNIPILSFFTGAGFLDIGFIQAGFEVIWSNEYDVNFKKGYEYGMSNLFGKDKLIHNSSSIIDVGPNQIAREAFHNTPKSEMFGMIGGPPCPDFSVGGKNLGSLGARGKLSQVYVFRILELQPTFFLFENVKGLLGTQRHRAFFNDLCLQLSKDYILEYRVLNTLDYGIPQDRERVFLIGLNRKWARKKWGKTLNDKLIISWPNNVYEGAKSLFNWPSEIPYGENPPKPEGIPDNLMVESLICNTEETYRLPNGLEWFTPRSNKFTIISEGDTSRKSFKRLHRWRYSPTVAYGNNEVHLHPKEPRRLSVREALRIQSVPDKYILPEEMPLTYKFKTIGNGVAVKLAYELACSIRNMIEGEPSDAF